MKKNQSIDQNQGKKTEIGQRINLIRTDFFDGDTAKLAEVLGIHYSNVSKIIKGEYSPNYESLRRLLESCPDLSALWLISGSGTMRNSQTINGKTIATITAAKRLGAFSYALQCAVREGLLPSNPFSALERGERLHPRQVERDYLTAEELQRLADTPCDDAVRSAYLFMCRCGLRISDVERLRWCDLMESDGRQWLSITVKKTQKPLSLPLSHTACAVLPPRNGKSASEPIFDLPAEQTMNKRLKEWAKAAGVNKKLSLHTARHTFATLLLTQGADVYTVSKLLGHSSVQTTQIYARIVDKKKEQAVDLLDKL